MAFGGKRGLVPYSKAWEQNQSSDDDSSESEIDYNPQQQTPISAPPPKFGGKRFHGKGAALQFAYHGNASPAANDTDSEYDDESDNETHFNQVKQHITRPKAVYQKFENVIQHNPIPIQPKPPEPVNSRSVLQQTAQKKPLVSSDPSSLLSFPKSSNVTKFPGKGARILQQFKTIDRLSDDEDSDEEAEFESESVQKPPPPPPPPPATSLPPVKTAKVKKPAMKQEVNLKPAKVPLKKRKKPANTIKKSPQNKKAKVVEVNDKVEIPVEQVNVKEKKKPSITMEEELQEILPIVSKIPKLKAWMESSEKTSDDVIYKLVGYLSKIGDFLSDLARDKTGREMEVYWEYIATKMPQKIGGQALAYLYGEMKIEIQKSS